MLNIKLLTSWVPLGLLLASATVVQSSDLRLIRLVRRSSSVGLAHKQALDNHKRMATAADMVAPAAAAPAIERGYDVEVARSSVGPGSDNSKGDGGNTGHWKRTQGGTVEHGSSNEAARYVNPARDLDSDASHSRPTQGGGEVVTGPPLSINGKRTQRGGEVESGPAAMHNDEGTTIGGFTAREPIDGGDKRTTPTTFINPGAPVPGLPTDGGHKRTALGFIWPGLPIDGGHKRTTDAMAIIGGKAPAHDHKSVHNERFEDSTPRSGGTVERDVISSFERLVKRGMLPLGGGAYFASHGRVTWYAGHSMDAPACGGARPSENDYVAAVPKMLASKCGHHVLIHHNGKTVKAKIIDWCQDCEDHHLDVSPSTFKALAPLDVGDIKDVHYRVLAKREH